MPTEIRHALRSLLRDLGFAITVILSLAVGIGANTAIFSLVNGILLRPPDYRDPGRLVSVSVIVPKFAKLYPALPVNVAMLLEWRKEWKSAESIGAWRPDSTSLTGEGEPELLASSRVSANFFSVLGIQPRLGRGFREAEDRSGQDRVAILSDALWRRRFHADPAVLGRKILLSGVPHDVVGVLPPDFQFPQAQAFGNTNVMRRSPDLFRPIGYENDDLPLHFGDMNFWPIARLRPGVAMRAALAELNVLQSAISAKLEENVGLQAGMKPIQEQMAGDSRRGLLLVMGAVGAVLLILLVNLANLSLVRAAARARESAIRNALGAGRWRLVRQSLTETMLLALTGGGLGVALAFWGVRALKAGAPVDLPRLAEVRVDVTVLLFAIAVSLAAGAAVGIFPALRGAAGAPFETLKSAGRANTESRGGLQLRNLLVTLEVALSTTLLVTAGLLTASFVRVMSVDKGYDIERVLAADISLPSAKYPDGAQRNPFFKRLIEKMTALPGVQSVALVSALPLDGETWIDIVGTEHDTRPMVERPSTNVRFISPGYFALLKSPLAAGRDFEPADEGRRVTIVSNSLAQRLWPGENPVGRKMSHGTNEPPMEVVGVTPDIRSTSLDHDPVNMMYIPYWQRSRVGVSILVRTAMDPRGIGGALRETVWSVDRDVPVPEVRTLEQVAAKSIGQRRFQMWLLALFAGAALALAAFGTYGVVAYTVARRRAEMGIRMALGAGQGNVLAMIFRQGMMPVLAGLVAGAVGALLMGSFVASLLFEVSPRDPAAFLVASAFLLAVAAGACLVPARRATRVNPIEALRFE